ncbi:hypothetical protein [Croceitalea rosinachiae]|uniref:Uncharacterized protein n=1 Tax=Croceitalea rosinachiae TaxID=3075596 RepID=A0ABU3A6V5_9FLAO|nr:hypothetical protein [Croceitalea sp. F388]MDT0605907.1 hypothetical protein [Croceitalea sp. F388]
MKSHFSLTDNEFLIQLETATLKPEFFDHQAHLRLAWLNINRFGIETAVKKTSFYLKKYVHSLDEQDKFNQTLTVAALKAVYHFKLKSKSTNFKNFIEEFPRLLYNFKDLMAMHYGFDIYHSEYAKKTYLAPDLLPFD